MRTALPVNRSGTDAVVVGAGVIGLTTGVCLAEAGLTTHIVTAAPTERTTSYAAGAICGPVFDETDDPVGAWSQVGFDEFTALAANPRTGVRLRESVFVSPAGMTVPRRSCGQPRYELSAQTRCPPDMDPASSPPFRASTCRGT